MRLTGLSFEQADEKYAKGTSNRTVIGTRKWICRFKRDLRQDFRDESIPPTSFSAEMLPSVVSVTRKQAIEIMISKK